MTLNQLCEHFEKCLQNRPVQTKLGSQMGIEPVEQSERENLQLGVGCTVEALIERHQAIAVESCMRTDKEAGKDRAPQFFFAPLLSLSGALKCPGSPHARSARPLPSRRES
jgi:hypothetical protein